MCARICIVCLRKLCIPVCLRKHCGHSYNFYPVCSAFLSLACSLVTCLHSPDISPIMALSVWFTLLISSEIFVCLVYAFCLKVCYNYCIYFFFFVCSKSYFTRASSKLFFCCLSCSLLVKFY